MWRVMVLGLLCGSVSAADLRVQVSQIQQQRGQLLLALHNQAETWSGDTDFHSPEFQAYRVATLPVQGTVMEYVFHDLPPGRYALGVIHDENGDGRMNRHIYPLVGMPEEPYALSNDAWSWFSKASFEAAAFELPAAGRVLQLPLRTHWQRWRGQEPGAATSD